ncbi:MAG: fibronectin type III domain-containing protein [Pseudomonadota bacterium]
MRVASADYKPRSPQTFVRLSLVLGLISFGCSQNSTTEAASSEHPAAASGVMSVVQSAGEYGSNHLECRFGPAMDSCPGFMTCGGGGTPGVCGCTPRSSFPANACGVYAEDCGGYVDFGGCSSGQICGGDRVCRAEASYQSVGCGPLQSGRSYKFAGASTPGTCFSISGSDIVLDGDGKTLTAGTAFELLDGAKNVVIKNFVIDADTGVVVHNNHAFPTTCDGLPQNIRIAGNRFVRGGIGMFNDGCAACNFSIEGNRFETGFIDLHHYSYNYGVGGHVISDNVIETPYLYFSNPDPAAPDSVGGVFGLWHLYGGVVLNNTIKGLAGIADVQRMAILDNTFHVTAAVPMFDPKGLPIEPPGKAMLKLAGVIRSRLAGNYIHNEISEPGTIVQFAVNTYGVQRSEFLWNTVFQQVRSQYPNSAQIGINFRSGGADNFLYKNDIRAYGGSGRGIQIIYASATCSVDVDIYGNGTTGDCQLRRFVIDSNTIVSTDLGIGHWQDGGLHLIRNNSIVAPGVPVSFGSCGQTVTYVNNLLDANGGAGMAGSCPMTSSNDLVYSPSMSGWFRNRSAYDYHLLGGATGAIDQATANPLVPFDADGVVRPFGATADLGSHEFVNDSQAPSAPTGLVAAAQSWSRIRLNWNAASDNDAVAAYNVYRYSASSGLFEFLKKLPARVTADYGLAADTLYRYEVSALDRSGNESPLSAEVSARTFPGFADPVRPTPNPANSTIPHGVIVMGGYYAPDGQFRWADGLGSFSITIRDGQATPQPVPNALVSLDLSACPYIQICSDTPDLSGRLVTGRTDSDGNATLSVIGRYGVDPLTIPPGACAKLTVNGVAFPDQIVTAVDPDRSGGAGPADLSLIVADLSGNGGYRIRSDIDGNGALGPNDQSLWLEYFFDGGSVYSCSKTGTYFPGADPSQVGIVGQPDTGSVDVSGGSPLGCGAVNGGNAGPLLWSLLSGFLLLRRRSPRREVRRKP